MKKTTFNQLLNMLGAYKDKGSLLDIGCAFGYLLEVAKEKGWDAHGIEISDYAAQKAGMRIGTEKIMIGNFTESKLPKWKFDVIMMVDFIEHTYDVKVVLKKCEELLKDGGILAIVTPNIDSFSYKLLRRKWLHFKGEHVIYFSIKSMKNILNMNNMDILRASNFKKVINFYYLKSQICRFCGGFSAFVIKIADILTPKALKKINFFMPQGEMMVIARKK